MANLSNKNPLIGDSLGDLTTRYIYISSIRVIASGDTWQLILKDNDGNEIFNSASDVTNVRESSWTPQKEFGTNGIDITTLTDISKVYVYVAREGTKYD